MKGYDEDDIEGCGCAVLVTIVMAILMLVTAIWILL